MKFVHLGGIKTAGPVEGYIEKEEGEGDEEGRDFKEGFEHYMGAQRCIYIYVEWKGELKVD